MIEKKSVLTAVDRYMVESIRLAHLAGSCSWRNTQILK